MTEYLSKEDVEVARSNGINYDNAYNRIYNLGWEKERAITQPIKKKPNGLWTDWKHIAKAHGIKDCTFLTRVTKQGMTPEEAATTPVLSKTEIARKANQSRFYHSRISKTMRERAESNGISYTLLSQRIYRLKWDSERACTEPPGTNKMKSIVRK